MTDRNGQPPNILLTLEGRERLELGEYEISGAGLVLTRSSGRFLIPFHTIRAVQFVPQKGKSMRAAAHSSRHL